MPFLSSVSAFVSGRGGSPPSCRHDTALQSDKLVADDPHRHVRNPLYAGVFLTNAGLGLLASRLGFCVLFLASLVFYWRLLLREEAQMLATQGESYARFLERVPCFWPSLTPRLPASGRTPEWGQAFLGEVTIWALAWRPSCMR